MHRRQVISMAPAAALATLAPRLKAADERSTVVRLVVPYTAGGQTDLLARAMAPVLARAIDRHVIVENKAGAAALIGTRAVQSAPPDGNTVLFHNSGFVALPLLTRAPTYDPIRDFAPVALVGYSPNFLMIHGAIPARTLPEFIAWARAQPAGIEASNAGAGSAGHLATQLFAKRADIPVTHVSYKGTSETQNALISGEVRMQLTSASEVMTQQARAGRIRILAVNARERSPLVPDVPTIAETLPGFHNEVWFGLLAPAGSPADAIQRLSEGFRQVMAQPEIRARFAQNYMDVQYRDAAAFAAVVADSQGAWKSMIRELGIQPA